MTLTFRKRAAAMAAAIAATAVIINVIAEIGHPPPPGVTLLSRWLEITGGQKPAPTRVASTGLAASVAPSR
jgi:hypothetical protein